jgi:hypothetical protein
LDARDYAEWCGYAGLYLNNVSHADRYRAYERKLSGAGFVTYLVRDFLEQNGGGIDLSRWRSSDVYERGADAAYRVEQTALALEAVGADRLAAKVRTARDSSISALFDQHTGDPQALMEAMRQLNPADLMAQLRQQIARAMPGMAADAGIPLPEPKPAAPDAEVESWERVEFLLQQYALAHDAELKADLAKYGDVRTEPGFDPRKRLDELARLRERELDQERQRDAAETLARLQARLEEKLARDPTPAPGAIASLRRKFLDAYREYAGRPSEALVRPLGESMQNAARFQEAHARVFRPRPTEDPALLARLDEVGPYDVDIDKRSVRVSWDSPKGLECDWTTFSLTVEFPAKKKKTLRRLLDGYDRLRRRFPDHQATLRSEVLESFETHRDWLGRTGFDGYECDASGHPTERSVLAHAGRGDVCLSVPDESEDDSVAIAVSFGVDWDDEHGLQVYLDDEPDTAPDAASRVAFHEGGPPLSPEDLAAFEREYAVTLPPDYRAFLMAHNGGRPEPDHFQARVQGDVWPVDIVRFFSIEPAQDANSDRSLGAAVVSHLGQGLPAHLLPIALASTPGPFGESDEARILLGLGGKLKGKVLVGLESPVGMTPGGFAAAAAAMKAAMFEAQCVTLAPNIASLVGRLIPRPCQPVPEWLEAIRAGDSARFLDWLERGGKLTEQFTPYGGTFLFSVTDYLAREGDPAFLRAVLDRSAIKPKQLRDSWLRFGTDLDRFRQLLPLFAPDQWRYAFAAPAVWDDPALLARLVEAGVDLNGGIDDEGATPLHTAVRNGRPDGVRWLLGRGADAGRADKFGRTALVWAENARDLESLTLLLDAGERFDSLFPHMPTAAAKLRLMRGRWFDKFGPLVDELKRRGLVTDADALG